MKRLDTIQNTEEWHKLREGKLGASDANIIMGTSKSITPLMLYKQKALGEEINTKGLEFIFEQGHKTEEKLRNIAEMIFDTEFPSIVALSEQYNFLMASLDGYSKDLNTCWECKLVGQEDYDKVANQEMLMHYYPQVQQQMLVSGSEKCIFMVMAKNKEAEEGSLFPYKYCFIEVLPDIPYIKNDLLPKMIEFNDMVKNKRSPDVSEKDVIDFSEDEEFCELLGNYKEVKDLLEIYTKQEKDLNAKIFKKLGKTKKAICLNVKITQSKSEDKETFDYKKFESENPIEKEYMKTTKGRITKRITFPKV